MTTRITGFTPPACYTSICVAARLGGPKGLVEWLPLIPSPVTSYKDGEPQTAVSPIGAHQCGILMVSTMAATSMSIHHK